MPKIERALAELQLSIEAGAEFPDALFRVSQSHNVDYLELTEAYDDADRNRAAQRNLLIREEAKRRDRRFVVEQHSAFGAFA